MRFLADMGVADRVVKWLRSQGHDVVHLREHGLHRLPDLEIVAKALAERRVILTFDLDFGEIVALAGGRRIGVILFRLHNTRPLHVVDRLTTALTDSMVALEQGAVVVVEETRHRVRLLPIGRVADAEDEDHD